MIWKSSSNFSRVKLVVGAARHPSNDRFSGLRSVTRRFEQRAVDHQQTATDRVENESIVEEISRPHSTLHLSRLELRHANDVQTGQCAKRSNETRSSCTETFRVRQRRRREKPSSIRRIFQRSASETGSRYRQSVDDGSRRIFAFSTERKRRNRRRKRR